jgi:signal transduction histidine kinase/AraC-like DNA-binding protein/DNA-binding LacI/PurR family transcriptional regulator
MSKMARIGIQITHGDPFWVQVNEVIHRQATHLPIELVEVALDDHAYIGIGDLESLVEEIRAQDLDVLLCNSVMGKLLPMILEQQIPIIYLSEIAFRHPLLTSRSGLAQAARMLGLFLKPLLPNAARILIVGGGLHSSGDDGASRIQGFREVLTDRPDLVLEHLICGWPYEDAYRRMCEFLQQHPAPFQAIYGLSDSIALAAIDAMQLYRVDHTNTMVVGINGDPLALAAIEEGRMTATIETDVADIAAKALDLACRAAHGEQNLELFHNEQRLVNRENVREVAVRKLISLADLPTRLVGVNRQAEQRRIDHLEASLAINRQVGTILDRQALVQTIAELIRSTYDYDEVVFWVFDPHRQGYIPSMPGMAATDRHFVTANDESPLGHAIRTAQPVAIPDLRMSRRFPGMVALPGMRSRLVVPVRLGGMVRGLLDLQRRRVSQHTRQELTGLQLLADQLAIAMRNAELYGEALAARAVAEKADQLKTRLLANVSHELRTPLNLILGYSQSLLQHQLASQQRHDLEQIQHSGEHLLRLINDLLDLSRAEIGELRLVYESVDLHTLISSLFRAAADQLSRNQHVAWKLDLPQTLPNIDADPVRLHQILLNLLHNAQKFTATGTICLGARPQPPYVHIWVSDTGSGIPPEQQEQIFEPFVSFGGRGSASQHEGIGLGLVIVRRLVELHAGMVTLESQYGYGSIFHLYLPLVRQVQHNDPPPTGDQSTQLLLKPVSAEQIFSAIHNTEVVAHAPILIVDDDPEMRQLYQRLIQERLPDQPIRSAAGGQAAIDLASAETPSLVILDLIMPDVDGFAVLEWLRGEPRTRQVPVLVLSGHLLNSEDIRRLSYPRVVLHTKATLREGELSERLIQARQALPGLPPATSTLVKRAIGYIQQHYGRALARQEIADAVGVSKDYLSRIFQQELGLSPWEYLLRFRIRQARELLKTSDLGITAIAERVGFEDAAYFSRVFHREVGVTPRAYRERGATNG